MNGENLETTPCEKVREILWPLDSPREWRDGETAARRHLETCEACAEFFRRDAAVGRMLRRAELEESAPGTLREKVFDALARERTLGSTGRREPSDKSVWFRRRSWFGAAAAIVVAVFAGLVWSTVDRADVTSVYVDDYMSRAVGEDVLETGQPESVSKFFMRELGVKVLPVAAEEARISRAMVCLIKGERAAMVEYEVDGMKVAHYRLPLDGPRSTPTAVRADSERGVQIVRWTDGSFEHALVSELPKDRLTRLVATHFASH